MREGNQFHGSCVPYTVKQNLQSSPLRVGFSHKASPNHGPTHSSQGAVCIEELTTEYLQFLWYEFQ